MGCTNCSNSTAVPKGCKSNGSCGTSGCDKLAVHDWLSNIELPSNQQVYDIVEVRFKNTRKEFYRNSKQLNLYTGDVVVVASSFGYDIGTVSVSGELARIQVRKKSPQLKAHTAREILRKGTDRDIEKWKMHRDLEQPALFKSRELASRLGLKMKISDVEYQGDGSKAIVYYTAEDRIDFRQLVRDLAYALGIRIEMKQIGARQEAARIGGIGSCGRELCCSTWLTDLRSVSATSARYQQLSLNPQKLSGQCGKLKCCLNYELDSYLEVLKSFPKADIPLQTEKGKATHVKTDVFKEQMWYALENKETGVNTLVLLSPNQVREIIAMNRKGKKPAELKGQSLEEDEKEPDYTNVVGQDDLNRFESVFKRKRKRKLKPHRQQQKVQRDSDRSSKPTAAGKEHSPSKSSHPPRRKDGNKEEQEKQKSEPTKKQTEHQRANSRKNKRNSP